MTALHARIRRMFEPQATPTASGSIVWWEARQIPVNLLIGAYGLACLPIFLWGLVGSGHLQPGEESVEPLAFLFGPIAFNACYTLGWLVEASLRGLRPGFPPSLGPTLLAAGLAFSVCVVTLPAALWGGYRCLQLLGVAA